jgi:cell division protein FtsB
MAPAPARRSQSSAPRVRPAAPRPQVLPGGGQRIRWDRLGRTALLLVLVGMAALYIGPLASFWAARGQASTKRAEVQQLRRENHALRARREALSSSGALEAEARRRGMVRPGERAFVVEHLPTGP